MPPCLICLPPRTAWAGGLPSETCKFVCAPACGAILTRSLLKNPAIISSTKPTSRAHPMCWRSSFPWQARFTIGMSNSSNARPPACGSIGSAIGNNSGWRFIHWVRIGAIIRLRRWQARFIRWPCRAFEASANGCGRVLSLTRRRGQKRWAFLLELSSSFLRLSKFPLRRQPDLLPV